MSLHGFRYTIRWSHNFTKVSEPPAGKEDLVAFTEAPAETFGGMEIIYDRTSELYSFKRSKIKVKIRMDKPNSWYLEEFKTDKLKKHEQFHYNISALSGRDLERGLKAMTAETPEELIKMKDDLTLELQNKVIAINEEYDSNIMLGTDHGRNEINQGSWEMHIKNLMNNSNAELVSIYA